MHGIKRGRDEEGDQPASSKFARREYATDVTSASRIQHILAPGTVLPLWGLGDADGVLGYITVDDNKIDIGGSAFIVGGKTADGYKVALKVFTTPMHDYQVTLIRRELATVRKLAPHPNILSFLGTCPHQNAILVSPLMWNGNLLRYLERYPATDRHKLVVQVAEALCHVHDVLKLIHGDLKCENVLISDEGDALLADFGLSTAIEKTASDVTTVSEIRQKSTLRFNAPELMLGDVQEVDERGQVRVRSKTTATDMYAFGMLILQAFTSQRPWPQLRHEMQIITTVCYARRIHPRPDAQSPAVAAGFTDQHWDICASCWNFEPQDRPKIRHVLSALVQSTIREDPMWSGVRALEYDPTYRTSSRPEQTEAITSERAAYSGQPAYLHLQQPGPSSLPPPNFAGKFQSGELQAAYARITRPLYEAMHTEYMAQRGIHMNASKRVVEGRVVDIFELHKAHFQAQGIGRQLPDDMWQLLAGKIGFGQPQDNLRGSMSTAHMIKKIYEHYLQDFDVAVAQKLLEVRHRQQQDQEQSGVLYLPLGAAPSTNTFAPVLQPCQPPQMQQVHGGPPFVPPAPQGAVNAQPQLMPVQQRLQQTSMAHTQGALLQHQHQQRIGQPGLPQVTMTALAGPPQTQLHQSHAFEQPQLLFGEPLQQQQQQQSKLGLRPPSPVKALPLDALSHLQTTRFAASQNSRPSHIIPIQFLGEWSPMFEKLLTVCKDVDVLLPYVYSIHPDETTAKLLIDIKLAANEQLQYYDALSSTHPRVFIDTTVLQRFIAFVSEWTLKARALLEQLDVKLNPSVASLIAVRPVL